MTLSSRIHDLTTAVASAINARAGKVGASAYDLAVLNGFVGSQSAWLASLKGSGGGVGMITKTVPTSATTGWTVASNAASLTSDGTELKLTNTAAGQFSRWYYTGPGLVPPTSLGPLLLQFDVMIDNTPAAYGGSVGMVWTSAGEATNFCIRLDVDPTGRIGMRFEQDGSSNLGAVMPIAGLALGQWITVKFFRNGGQGAGWANGSFCVGTEGGTVYNNRFAPTLLMYGGTSVGMVAHYRNISFGQTMGS